MYFQGSPGMGRDSSLVMLTWFSAKTLRIANRVPGSLRAVQMSEVFDALRSSIGSLPTTTNRV